MPNGAAFLSQFHDDCGREIIDLLCNSVFDEIH